MTMRTDARDVISGVRICYEGRNFPGQDGANDIIQELWGAGYTIVERPRDPFSLPVELIPLDKGYQWMPSADVQKHVEGGWSVVPAYRHDGRFAPVGYRGDIEVGGMTLMERPNADVDAAHAERIAKAHKNVDDWMKCTQDSGLVGSVSVLSGGELRTTEIGVALSATETKIPRDMWKHIDAIYAERDRLRAEAKGEIVSGELAKITETAIANVRARLSAEKENAA